MVLLLLKIFLLLNHQTVFDDGQKLKLTDAEIVDFLFSKGTLPEQWDSFMDGIKLNDHYRKNWFNLREALLDHGIGKGYTGENATYSKSAREQSGQKEAMDASTLANRKCFFCNGKGHMKNECSKFAEWKKKKGFQKEKSAAPRTWQGEKVQFLR